MSEIFASALKVSTHSRLKAAGVVLSSVPFSDCVSTHSRLKAAGCTLAKTINRCRSFNTQPPEGGWKNIFDKMIDIQVSTHSRLKAAGGANQERGQICKVSTHSRLKAAGFRDYHKRLRQVCFNTQPPEGGWLRSTKCPAGALMFQHTAA